MNIFDVLYTPLDTPAMPPVDVPKLLSWIDDNHDRLHNLNKNIARSGTTAEGILGNKYPWKLTPIYFNNTIDSTGWLNEFDVKFPELSTYLHSAFDLTLNDLSAIMLLPTLSTHEGIGFWHQDVDHIGLRMYLEFDDIDNKLYLRKTKIKHEVKPDHRNLFLLEKMLQPEIIDCKLHSKNQCFFINNKNAAHTIYTNVPGKTRIAAFLVEKVNDRDRLLAKIEPLVVNSAIKFKDYSIIW
jgi:hypothetical protein